MAASEEERWKYLNRLDREFLTGGATLSEWSAFITRETDIAFANGAFLAALLTAVSAIETHLRAEYASGKKHRLARLIDESPIDSELKNDIHALRRFRNKWVHVDDPYRDEHLLDNPEQTEEELQNMAFLAVRVLRKTMYYNQWV